MRIGIFGSGAMGRLFAARLLLSPTANQHKIHLFANRTNHDNDTQFTFNSYESPHKDSLVKVSSCADSLDVAILLTKANYASIAAEKAAAMLKKRSGVALCLMNGMGYESLLRDAFAANALVFGTTSASARIIDGSLVETGKGTTLYETIGKATESSHLLDTLASALNCAQISTNSVASIQGARWTKLAVNCAINPLTSIYKVQNGFLVDDSQIAKEMRAVIEQIVDEVNRLAATHGLELDAKLVDLVLKVAKDTAANESSMLRDVTGRRPTEIEFLNGFVVREAHARGIKCPANEHLYNLVKNIEASYA